MIWQSIIEILKTEKIPAYPPGVKTGKCTFPYVVVKPLNGSQYQNYSSTVQYYDILCYAKTISELENICKQAKGGMEKIAPTIKPTYIQSEPFFDSDIEAWMSSMTYRNFKKII